MHRLLRSISKIIAIIAKVLPDLTDVTDALGWEKKRENLTWTDTEIK